MLPALVPSNAWAQVAFLFCVFFIPGGWHPQAAADEAFFTLCREKTRLTCVTLKSSLAEDSKSATSLVQRIPD